MAARTKYIQLGSMVVVLPWHDQMRVAEQVSMLDTLSGGRLILGMGRGAGRIEFDGFGVPMKGSRERFVESTEILLKGLEHATVSTMGTSCGNAKLTSALLHSNLLKVELPQPPCRQSPPELWRS